MRFDPFLKDIQDYEVSIFPTFAAFNIPSTDPPNDLTKFDLEVEIPIDLQGAEASYFHASLRSSI